MQPPYYAVIFTNKRTEGENGYAEMAQKMEDLARKQTGFLGFESARDEIGISVSYWESLEDILKWKTNTEHLFAQQKGKSDWYAWYKVRICFVEREYGFNI
ncbi:antibiotic biosynthesis monooxygenase family protein [Maribacter luteus]|uniref:Antibiotic biosynthesis monooxygenase n=1 Tax=Maribacter luteus TaxID=2594478 RepID=A0A6I2MIM5_9FLAO|nr:antibiotic biosynthesis monooxygenase [Maribacter luteus]MRX63002.1 antibiotic biosynthesis monooxygenase [Maribacter luteus]|tara:strand:- start:2775 stop:3077 length:303 start_codon:yes stop_codon:yes gene_type:complete